MFIQCPSRVGALIFPSIVTVFIDKFDFMYVLTSNFAAMRLCAANAYRRKANHHIHAANVCR